MIVVALTGYKRAGKDSVADILVRDHGFTKMAFADPIKRLVRTLNPIVGVHQEYCCRDCQPEAEPVYLSDLYDDYGLSEDDIKDSRYGEEVRRIWQRFGTELFRAEDPNFWIDVAEDAMLTSGVERVVFTDCRFPNEARWVHELSYNTGCASSVWQIARPGHEADPEDHSSESHVGLMGEEITVHNDGSLEDLAVPVNTALEFTKLNAQPMLPFGAEGLVGYL